MWINSFKNQQGYDLFMLHLSRLHKLQQYLRELACDGLLIEDPIDLFYMTGLELSSGRLLAHHFGADLLVDNRYFENCQKVSPFPVFSSDKTSFLTLLERPELSYLRNLGFDSEKISYKDYQELEKQFHHRAMLKPLESPIKHLRIIKDETEISLLQRAAALGSDGFDFVCSFLKEGISEVEVATELEIFWKKRGSKGLAFQPIIAFGANSSMPHYRAGSSQLQKGQSVLIDIGVNYQHYHSDMTRVVFFGTPPKEIQEIYPIVKEAQRLALEKCTPGTLVGDLDQTARQYIVDKGYGEYFIHSLGHGVGLEIHEFPTLRNKPPFSQIPLKQGMVITIEPGIYLPGIGGVRLEDTVLITEEGHENLTNRSLEPQMSPKDPRKPTKELTTDKHR
jgi:Xaa-Pro aminopeptidase